MSVREIVQNDDDNALLREIGKRAPAKIMIEIARANAFKCALQLIAAKHTKPTDILAVNNQNLSTLAIATLHENVELVHLLLGYANAHQMPHDNLAYYYAVTRTLKQEIVMAYWQHKYEPTHFFDGFGSVPYLIVARGQRTLVARLHELNVSYCEEDWHVLDKTGTPRDAFAVAVEHGCANNIDMLASLGYEIIDHEYSLLTLQWDAFKRGHFHCVKAIRNATKPTGDCQK